MPVRKSEEKGAYGFQISDSYGSFSNDIMAVKGLIIITITTTTTVTHKVV